MEYTLWTKETAPHEVVKDVSKAAVLKQFGKWGGSECGVHQGFCARCHWDHPEVVKVRARKLSKLRRWEREGDEYLKTLSFEPR